ncbi:recombinase family protein [Aminipila terrae]|uniref:recombinase family protein n=1 Tax=Aminipila terrae TaxID=2697030 RepID=UPI001FAC4E1C|nr:recombinase family protein [Aminipila terrae]
MCNEKYAGDLITQKTVITDFLEHKQQKNKGQEKQLYFMDHHEPIINRETWDMAREEYSRRSIIVDEKSKYSNRYWCSGKVKCGVCGANCVTRTSLTKNYRWRAWQCSQAYTYGKPKTDDTGNKKGCTNKLINEKNLISCVHFALQHITFLKEEIYEEMQEEINGFQGYNCKELISSLKKEIKVLDGKKEKLIDLYLEKRITQEEFEKMKRKYTSSIGEKQHNLKKIEKNNDIKFNSANIMEQIKKILFLNMPAPELYAEIVEKIILYENRNLDIFFMYIPDPVCIHYETTGKGESYKTECNIRN